MKDKNSILTQLDEHRQNAELPEFPVVITETLKKVVNVRAEDAQTAEQIVADGWYNSEHIISAEDFIDVEFSVKDVNLERENNVRIASEQGENSLLPQTETPQLLAFSLDAFYRWFDPYEYIETVNNPEEKIANYRQAIENGGERLEDILNQLQDIAGDFSFIGSKDQAQSLIDGISRYRNYAEHELCKDKGENVQQEEPSVLSAHIISAKDYNHDNFISFPTTRETFAASLQKEGIIDYVSDRCFIHEISSSTVPLLSKMGDALTSPNELQYISSLISELDADQLLTLNAFMESLYSNENLTTKQVMDCLENLEFCTVDTSIENVKEYSNVRLEQDDCGITSHGLLKVNWDEFFCREDNRVLKEYCLVDAHKSSILQKLEEQKESIHSGEQAKKPRDEHSL